MNPTIIIRFIILKSQVIYHLDDDIAEVTNEKTLAQDDVMSLINLLFKATQSTTIKSSTGDPFWEKAEMIFYRQ